MSDLAAAHVQGFRRWRRLPNGVEVLSCRFTSDHRGYRAFRAGACVGAWSQSRTELPCGHVDGDYSQVQGTYAPCSTVTLWLAAVGGLDQAEAHALLADQIALAL